MVILLLIDTYILKNKGQKSIEMYVLFFPPALNFELLCEALRSVVSICVFSGYGVSLFIELLE